MNDKPATTETSTLMSMETFMAYTGFCDRLMGAHSLNDKEIMLAVADLMERAARDALKLGSITMEVQP